MYIACIYIYIYIYTHKYVYIYRERERSMCVYIYIYREREIDSEREREREIFNNRPPSTRETPLTSPTPFSQNSSTVNSCAISESYKACKRQRICN